MLISDAKLQDGWLCLRTQPSEAYRWLCSYKPQEYDIKKSTKQRSKNANALAWKLIGEISKVIGDPPIVVYQYEISCIGGITDTLTCSRTAYEAFDKAFCKDHIGRRTEIVGEDEDAGTVDVLITYGSSDYDTRQMSKLIDNIIQDCKQLGIETPEDEYVNTLVAEWEARNG